MLSCLVPVRSPVCKCQCTCKGGGEGEGEEEGEGGRGRKGEENKKRGDRQPTYFDNFVQRLQQNLCSQERKKSKYLSYRDKGSEVNLNTF